MRLFIILLLLTVGFQAQAQFGFSARTNLNNFNAWEDFYQVNDISTRPFRNTIDLGVNYWLRLKNKRVEFLPELTYSLEKSDDLTVPQGDNFSNTLTQYGFNLNTHIYFMDLDNDCNCPTFSKQGTFVPKAIHLIINPGVYIYRNDLVIERDNLSELEHWGRAFKLGAGLGLDIGISDLLTITPFTLINFTSAYTSCNLDIYNDPTSILCNEGHPNSNNFHPQFGLRISFRPDYVKSNRY